MIQSKVCAKCRQEKPVSEFYAAPRSKDGTTWSCKQCLRADKRKWVENAKASIESRLNAIGDDILVGTKTCRICGETKPKTEFSKRTQSSDCLDSRCKTCSAVESRKHYDRNVSRAQSDSGFQVKYRERQLRACIKRKYGISLDAYDRLLGSICVCDICERPTELGERCLDHDHETGQIRGVLCRKCNSALGLLSDDTKRLENAIAYLRSAPKPQITEMLNDTRQT